MKTVTPKTLFFITLIILLLAGYFIYRSKVQESPKSTDEPVVTDTVSIPAPADKKIEEKTDKYEISVVYPEYGVTAIDTIVRQFVDASVKDFKESGVVEMSEVNSLLVSYTTKIGYGITTIRFNGSQYTGGAHPLPFVWTIHFDAKGNIVQLADLFKVSGPTYFSTFSTIALADLHKQFGEQVFEEGADSNPENWNQWYTTDDALVFIFTPYQVAPYAAGTPEVSIPWENLATILK